jgi:hypothetical protein
MYEGLLSDLQYPRHSVSDFKSRLRANARAFLNDRYSRSLPPAEAALLG